MESNNPFEQPRTESPAGRDDSRRNLFIFAAVIVLLEAIARRMVERGLTLNFLADPTDLSMTFTWSGTLTAIGPIFGALLGYFGSARRALVIAPLLAATYAVSMRLGLPILPPTYSMVHGLIWAPLAVAIGRSVLAEPELRDAWFVLAAGAGALGSFFGELLALVGWEPLIIGALLSTVIAVLAAIFFRPRADTSEPPQRSPVWIVLAGVVLIQLMSFTRLQFQGSSPPVVILGGAALAVFYNSRNALHREERAKFKLAIGAVLTCLAVGASRTELTDIWAAVSVLSAAASLFVGPIAIGIAAAQTSEKKAYLWTAIFLIGSRFS